MDSRDTYQKIICGPMGFQCPYKCCLVADKKFCKVANSRGKRRKSKQEIKKLDTHEAE